jgi:predicted nucleic acid-binding protein
VGATSSFHLTVVLLLMRVAHRDDSSGRVDNAGGPFMTCESATVTRVTRYVIDARTLVHVVANDVPVDASHQIVAPNAIRSQALSLLLTAVQRGDLAEDVALRHHERLTELKMRLLGDRVSRRTAWRIAREQGWETVDEAEYLAVAKLQADALITIDPELAAKARDVVPLASLDALGAGGRSPANDGA